MLVLKIVNRGVKLVHNNPDSALLLFTEAETISRNTNFRDGIGYAKAYIGFAYSLKGDMAKSFAYYRQAEPYCLRATHIKAALPTLYINKGATLVYQGDYAQAQLYFHKALHYLERHLPGDKNIIMALSNLSSVYGRQGEYRKALQYARKAEQLAEEQKLVTALVPALVNVGNMYSALNKPDSALSVFRKGIALARKAGMADMEQLLLTSIGDLYLNRGDATKAIPYYEQAMSISRRANAIYGTVYISYSLGRALFLTQSFRKAEAVLTAAIEKAEASGFTENIQNAYETLSIVYAATGRHKEALTQRLLYEQIKDSLTGLEKAKAINEIETRYRTAQKDKTIAQHELEIDRQKKKIEQRNYVITGIAAGAAFIILSLSGLYYHRQQLNKQRRETEQLRAIIAGVEQERTRLAKELHDGIGGMLTGIKLNLKAIQNNSGNNALNGIMNMLKDMGEEIRKTSHNLMPHMLKKHRLPEALRAYIDQLDTKNALLHLELNILGDMTLLSPAYELHLYRIAQELIQNIIRHSGADSASILFRADQDMLYIIAEDNGRGFEPESVTTGVGLISMKERVHLLNGSLSIESSVGNGTIVHIELKLNNRAI